MISKDKKDEVIEKLLDVARANVGYLEKSTEENLNDPKANAGSNNYTKYARDYFPEMQGMAWCCIFVFCCFAYAFGEEKAIKILGGIKTARCAEQWEALKSHKKCRKNIRKAEKGDLIFFIKGKMICHIGIIIDIDKDNVKTIEGNTFVKNDELIESGDGVYQKYYELTNDKIYGVASPILDFACE